MTKYISLACPHTPWIPARADSMQRLRDELGVQLGESLGEEVPYREFTEREPNHIWSLKMWEWMVDQDTTWCVTLQDDVQIADCFWTALERMLGALDECDAHVRGTGGERATVCGLSSVHPAQVELQRQGHRWYRTSAWLVGWAYAIRRETLRTFLEWRSAHPEYVVAMTEDSLLNHFCTVSCTPVWHPIPATVDHDITLDSTYGNDAHVLRKPFITWRDFTAGSLCSPDFWRTGSNIAPMLVVPSPKLCWACHRNRAEIGVGPNLQLCGACVGTAAQMLLTQRSSHG